MIPHTTSNTYYKELQARVDLRDIAAATLGPGKRTGKSVKYSSPLRDDGQNDSFHVYADGYQDFGGRGDRGDALQFLQDVGGMSFAEAVAYLENWTGGAAPALRIVSKPEAQATAQHEPPPQAWQNDARTALDAAQAALWADTPEAATARAYLAGRGLTDETIKRFGLGLNAHVQWLTIDGQRHKLEAGITIPVWCDGALWAVGVRSLDPSDTWKYKKLSGSKGAGWLFNADAIEPGKPVQVAEGEFDAMLAQQHAGDRLTVVTAGSAPNHHKIARRWLDRLQECPVMICLDNDEAGRAAAEELAAQLPGAVVLSYPHGKDYGEYVEQGGDLEALLAQGRAIWPGGVPDGIRSVLLNKPYFGITTTAAVVELMNTAAARGLIEPDGFTIPQLLEANRILPQFNIPDRTIRNTFQSFVGYFVQEVGSIGTNILQTSCSKSDDKTSHRPAVVYSLCTADEIKRAIEQWAAPRIYEDKHGLTYVDNSGARTEILAEPTAAMLRDAGVIDTAAAAAAGELSQVLRPAYAKQGNAQVKARKAADEEMNHVRRMLQDTHSTPLPDGWPIGSAKEYRAAFAHVVINDRDSRANMARKLGVSDTALATVLKDAGIERKATPLIPVVIKSDRFVQEISSKGRELQAFPVAVEAHYSNRVVNCAYQGPDSAEFIQQHRANGAEIKALYQGSYENIRTRTEPLPAPEPQETSAPAESPVKPAPAPAIEDSEPARPRHYGPTYDPAWLIAQFEMALRLLDWQYQGGYWINPDTGEMYQPSAPLDYIKLLIGTGDALLDTARFEMGAVINWNADSEVLQ